MEKALIAAVVVLLCASIILWIRQHNMLNQLKQIRSEREERVQHYKEKVEGIKDSIRLLEDAQVSKDSGVYLNQVNCLEYFKNKLDAIENLYY